MTKYYWGKFSFLVVSQNRPLAQAHVVFLTFAYKLAVNFCGMVGDVDSYIR